MCVYIVYSPDCCSLGVVGLDGHLMLQNPSGTFQVYFLGTLITVRENLGYQRLESSNFDRINERLECFCEFIIEL